MIGKPKGHQKINAMHRQYFRDIFNLQASQTGGKLDFDGLERIFQRIDFKPTDKQNDQFYALFSKKKELDFQQFLQIFAIRTQQNYTQVDVLNSFRLLSKQYQQNGKIKLQRVKQILKQLQLKQYEIHQLTKQLMPLCDKQGYFDFQEFVANAF